MKTRLAATAAVYAIALIVGALFVTGHVGVRSVTGPDSAQTMHSAHIESGSSLLMCIGWGCNSSGWDGGWQNSAYNDCSNVAHGQPCATPGFHSQIQGYTTCWNCGVQIQNVPVNTCWKCGYHVQNYPPQCYNGCGAGYYYPPAPCWNCGQVQVVVVVSGGQWQPYYGWNGWNN